MGWRRDERLVARRVAFSSSSAARARCLRRAYLVDLFIHVRLIHGVGRVRLSRSRARLYASGSEDLIDRFERVVHRAESESVFHF